MVNGISRTEKNISRTTETVLSIIGGVAGLIVGTILIFTAFTINYYEPGFWLMLLGIISVTGGAIGVVSGAIFENDTQIANILAIVASILCLIGGVVILGIVGFILLLIAGILGFVRK